MTSPDLGAAPPHSVNDLGFCNASFTWNSSSDTFRLTIPDRVTFLHGAFNLIVGSTASGKSSLLLALLGEMHFSALVERDEAWYNVPASRRPTVAYVGQDTWLENRSIRDNIVFDEPFDENRYRKTLNQCALEPDLALFGTGDKTEVGEKGVTLRCVLSCKFVRSGLQLLCSGGQRARIAVARAVYSSAPIVLLDDVLSALDAHTSKWIIRHCLNGELLSGRTVILAVCCASSRLLSSDTSLLQTHNARPVVHLAKRVVHVRDGLVSIAEDLGEVIHEEEEEDYASTDESITAQNEDKDQAVKQDSDALDSSTSKIIMAEDVVVGRLQWSASE